jgi:hypothetical protein
LNYLYKDDEPMNCRVSLRRYNATLFNTAVTKSLNFVSKAMLFTEPLPGAAELTDNNKANKFDDEDVDLMRHGHSYVDSTYTRFLLLHGIGGLEVFSFGAADVKIAADLPDVLNVADEGSDDESVAGGPSL